MAVALAALGMAGAPGLADDRPSTEPVASPGLFTPSIVPGFEDRVAKPGPLLSDSDRAAFEDAYDAANRRDWPRALMLATRIRHKIAAKIITWGYLTADETNPAFDEIVRFLDANPDWPLQQTLLEKAEKALPDSMPPARLIAWFAGQQPLTGEGMLRLGEAMIATGDKDYGKKWLALAWAAYDFPHDRQSELFAKYKSVLAGQPTIDRVEHLLWSSHYEQAEALLSVLPEAMQRIARARIALQRQSSGALSLVDDLPAAERADPAIVFDQARYLRRMGRDDEASGILLSLKEPEKAPFPEKWWVERNYQAREALDAKKFDRAYKLLAQSGLTSGASFADAEWLAGWVALRFLNRPQAALKHFQKLETGVTYPISLARAHYWAGRAAQAMGNTELAVKAYTQAAEFPYTFYGQLGAGSSLLANQKLELPATPGVDSNLWGSFINGELVTAIRLLIEIDGERYMRTLAYELADKADSTGDLVLIADLLRQAGQTAISVRIAKRASQQGAVLTDYLYPLVSVPDFIGNGTPPEPALVLGLARQESEFNPRAVSSAGAVGIMQLLPSTARITANKYGLPYRGTALVSDPIYNMQIGMAHMRDLLDRYDGSYILIAAAYNAGANNVDKWIGAIGDPRKRGVDPVDWIESIPFTETRNYVQRVLENAVVYRHRMAGRPVEFTLEADLRRTSAMPVDLSYLKKPPQPLSPPAASPKRPQEASAAPSGAAASQEIAAPMATPVAPASPVEAAVPAKPLGPTAPAGLGLPPILAPSPEQTATTPEAGEGTTNAVGDGELFDRNWKIPAGCARFIIRPDGTGECIE